MVKYSFYEFPTSAQAEDFMDHSPLTTRRTDIPNVVKVIGWFGFGSDSDISELIQEQDGCLKRTFIPDFTIHKYPANRFRSTIEL